MCIGEFISDIQTSVVIDSYSVWYFENSVSSEFHGEKVVLFYVFMRQVFVFEER